MTAANDRPLISFCVLAYNQERFIREAVEAALAQSYEPLEVILSDDCSSDRTFAIMKEVASSYQGPHKAILNGNPRNSGVGVHVNRTVELSAGPLVVLAAGDDVSLPDRVQCLCDEWLRLKKLPTSIYSDYEAIDGDGRMIEEDFERYPFSGSRSAGLGDIRRFLRGNHPASRFLGATHAFSRELFNVFGPLNTDVSFEDKVIGFRSLLHGSFAYVPRKLVRYRMHDNNLCGRNVSSRASRYERVRQKIAIAAAKNHHWTPVLNNYRADLNRFASRGGLTRDECAALLLETDRCLKVKGCEYRIDTGRPLVALYALLCLLTLRPHWSDGWSATKHWLFRAADYTHMLPGRG